MGRHFMEDQADLLLQQLGTTSPSMDAKFLEAIAHGPWNRSLKCCCLSVAPMDLQQDAIQLAESQAMLTGIQMTTMWKSAPENGSVPAKTQQHSGNGLQPRCVSAAQQCDPNHASSSTASLPSIRKDAEHVSPFPPNCRLAQAGTDRTSDTERPQTAYYSAGAAFCTA